MSVGREKLFVCEKNVAAFSCCGNNAFSSGGAGEQGWGVSAVKVRTVSGVEEF